ncbi:hypothetical protein OGATHE_000127 [Ogataea polymorpha]|uniref:Uncharacterized protein n=1 Tax=Ogataea polymorpha TaxID=460523 RepID=A0A9P8PUV6_9ASCO|nr:hypothetical protein OGATHE_000127 [Ogataea polymorpha]
MSLGRLIKCLQAFSMSRTSLLQAETDSYSAVQDPLHNDSVESSLNINSLFTAVTLRFGSMRLSVAPECESFDARLAFMQPPSRPVNFASILSCSNNICRSPE